jgi:predicted transcriptional regulator of viral defense system
VPDTDKNITIKIEVAKDKTIFFTEDFREYGTPEAIKTAIHRLVKKGTLKRLGRGIYAKPEYSDLLRKEILPPLEEVAKAIAKRDQARIIPTGSYALHLLGLSTQVPMKIVYLTDGTPRKIKINNGQIHLKRTTPRNLSFKGETSTLVVQALREIGKDYVTEEDERKIIDVLKNEKYENLKHDIKIAPQWIAEIMARAL